MKILVAEDEPLTLQLVEFKLKQQGFQVLSAQDGEAAFNLAQSQHPDLIVLDGMMPIMDGFQVLRKLKETATLKDIPVVMLTTRGRDRDIEAGLDLGASDYIVKPFSPNELIARVKKLLRSTTASAPPPRSENPAQDRAEN